MPAFFTHKLTGDYILENMKNIRAKKIIVDNNAGFYSGTQGGDYFYFYRYYSMWAGAKLKMLGYAMHHMRPQRFFTESAEYIKEKNNDVLKSFYYGYITHYCLDKVLHPYIKKECKGYSSHLRLEHDLDSMYAMDKFGEDVSKINRGEVLKEAQDNTGIIDEYISYISKKVYNGFTVKENPYTLTYNYYIKMNKEIFDMSKRKYLYYKFVNIFMQIDVFSVIYIPIKEIKSSDNFTKFYDYIDIAIKDSYKLIDISDAYFNDEKDITVLQSAYYNVNFGGKVVIPFEDKKEFKRAYKKCKIKGG